MHCQCSMQLKHISRLINHQGDAILSYKCVKVEIFNRLFTADAVVMIKVGRIDKYAINC